MVDLVQFSVHWSFLVCPRGKGEGALLIHALINVVRRLGRLPNVPPRKDAEVALGVFDGSVAHAVRQGWIKDEEETRRNFNAFFVCSARGRICNRSKTITGCILLSVRAGRAIQEIRTRAKIDPTSKVGVALRRTGNKVFVPRLFRLLCAFFAKARAVFALGKVVAGVCKGF